MKVDVSASRSGSWRYVNLGFLALPFLAGCGLFAEDEAPREAPQEGYSPATEQQCSTTRDYFAREVWPQVMSTSCINCHAPGGLATNQFSSLQLFPPAYPGFLEESLDTLRILAKTEYEGTSVLLLKPRGELSHGGGAQLEEGSAEYRILEELVGRLQREDDCVTTQGAEPVTGLELLTPHETYHKARLLLVGELPSDEQVAKLDTEGEKALPNMIDALTRQRGFKEWLLTTFNDLLLTDRYMNSSTNTLRREDFPAVDQYLTDEISDEERNKYRSSVAREPLELINYIVENDRPFTEILTADYTVLNPYTARIYNNAGLSFENDQSVTEFVEAGIFAYTERGVERYPHAGVLSSPMFLNRFPTSPTNRNRHRARMVLDKFLATDILKVGARPIDPTQAVAFANPTREDPDCSMCHSIIDPIAGAFMHFSDNDQEQLVDREWFPEMFLPGFDREQMQVSDYERALPWVAQRIAQDPRFPLSVVYNTFRALTSQEPLEYPSDGEEHAFNAWQAQDTTLRAIAQRFVEDGYNYRTVVREIVLSAYFRGKNASEEAVAAYPGELDPYGSARLSTPEALARKVKAVVGFDWGRWDREPALVTTYNILYGGIDSENVTERLEEPNGVMASVMSRMANEVSCQATAWDFLQPVEERLLFPYVQVTDTPDSNPDAVRANVQYLHDHVLGERLAIDDPEVDRTYALFQQTWSDGIARVESEEYSRNPPWSCQGRWDRTTGEELPEGQRLEQDENYTVRSWMAVMTYLLSDYRFLYE